MSINNEISRIGGAKDDIASAIEEMGVTVPSGTKIDGMAALIRSGAKTRVPVYGMGKNLLDNWYFVGGGSQQGGGKFPINQRGQTSYSGNVFTIDRWSCYTGLDIHADGIDFSQVMPAQYAPSISQQLEKSRLIAGYIYNLSALWSDGTLWTNSGVLQDGSNWVIASGTVNSNGCAIRGRNVDVWQVAVWNTDTSRRLVAVKLELGTEQTLAHQENSTWVLNEIPDYEYELYRCITSTADPSDTYANKVLSTNTTNKNLLDNWYFMQSQVRGGQLPINRRGLTTLSTNTAYFIDRWVTFDGAGTVSVDSSGLSLVGTTNWFRFGQQIPMWKIVGRQITLSVLIGSISSGATFSIGIGDSTGDIVNNFGVDGMGQISATAAGLYQVTGVPTQRFSQGANANDLANCLFRITQGGTAVIKAVKIEYGSQQTLAHQENGEWVLNEIPDYSEELLKCETNRAGSGDTYSNKIVATNVSNKNLLDNWYFVGGGSQLGDWIFPINQRGQTTYSGQGYGIDRWQNASNTTVTISSDGISNAGGGFRQYIEAVRILNGQLYTLSLLTEYGLKYVTGYLNSSASGWQLSTDGTNGWAGVQYSSGKYDIRITGSQKCKAIKLELGTEQTLAHLEKGKWVLNEIPDFETEWNKCNKYLRIYYRDSTLAKGRMLGVRFSHESRAGYAMFALPIDPPMVSAPTVTNNSALAIRTITSGANVANVTFSFSNAIRNVLNIRADSSNITAGTLYWVDTLNAGNKIILSAEL